MITPTTLNNVTNGELQQFEICVNANHPLPSDLFIEFRDAVSNTLWGALPLVYRQTCAPGLLTEPLGGQFFLDCDPVAVPQCCCTIGYAPQDDAINNVDIRLEVFATGTDPSLGTVTIVPPVVNDVSFLEQALFDVCVDVTHNPNAILELRFVNDDTNLILAFARLVYVNSCEPFVDLGGTSLGIGLPDKPNNFIPVVSVEKPR